MSAAYYGTDALLLASRDWGEADRLLTFFTKELGRVDAVAKSVRLAKSKLRGHVTLFSRLRIMVTPGKEMWRLLDAEAVPMNIPLALSVHASDFARFFAKLVPEREQNIALWDVVSTFPHMPTQKELLLTKILVLKHMGMIPEDSDLGQFFSPHLTSFIKGEGDDSFFNDPLEYQKARGAIASILSLNHMV